jgi:hypothetical protein
MSKKFFFCRIFSVNTKKVLFLSEFSTFSTELSTKSVKNAKNFFG